MPRLRLKLLGGFEARLASGPVIEIAARKTRALLAYLALPPGRAHARDRLAALLWSDRGDKQARDSLRQALTELGRALDAVAPPPLLKERDTVALASSAVEVDALDFERLAAGGDAGELHRAAALYAGDLLDGIGVGDPAFEEWLGAERQRLRNCAIGVQEKLLARETGGGAVAVAQRLLALDPLREEGHRALMRLHADAGEIGLALRQYEICRETLRRDLDVAPSPETEALRRQLRAPSPAPAPRNSESVEAPVRAETSASKPSIAVLPFRNLSGDPAQRYFSDGITEDLITELSRFHVLTVIARHSSFAVADQGLEVTEIGKRLGARYVVEGSVRRAADRLRITARLIEAESGDQLWSERYDRGLTDIFDVQDEVVQAMVATLSGRIEAAGARSARRKRPENMAAYDYLLRGIERFLTFDDADSAPARALFEKALVLDPALATAHDYLAVLQLRDWWVQRSRAALDRAFALAKRAVALDANDARGHATLGYACLERREYDDAAFHMERAVALNPNDPAAALFMAALRAYVGRAEEGVARMETAFRLNPFPPQAYYSFQGMVLYAARRYAEAIVAFRRLMVAQRAWNVVYQAASHGQLGHGDEARAAIAAFAAEGTGLSLLRHAANEPYRNSADLEHLLDGLRKAGARE